MHIVYSLANIFAVTQLGQMNVSPIVPTGRDNATFWKIGTEVPSLCRDKGTTRQAKNLANGREGSAKIRDGPGRDSQNLGRDTGQNGTEQKRTF